MVSAFATLASGLVASARFVTSATLIIAAIVTVASTTIRDVGHDRALLLHVDFLSITPVIAPVVVTLVAAIVTTTTAATATTVATVIVVPALISGLLGYLLLLNHLSLDLFLCFDICILLLKLLPAKFLVLNHVLNELLNTLTDGTNTFLALFGVSPDLLELVQDFIVVLLGDLSLGSIIGDSLLNCASDLLNEFDGCLDSVILEAVWV